MDDASTNAAELARLHERNRKLAAEKSYLELTIRLMNRMRAVPGLDNTVENILRSVSDVIGGANLELFYFVDEILYHTDVFGNKTRIDALDDPNVRKVFETREAIEVEQPFSDTQLTTPEFSPAHTWVFPLIVGTELIGACKIEGLYIGMSDLYRQLPTFFHHAALVLKSEILGQTRLKQAYDALAKEVKIRKTAEIELRLTNEELEERVNQRTADLQYERALMSRIMETSPVGIAVADQDGQLTFANARAAEILGLVPNEITRRTFNSPAWQITAINGEPFPEEELPFRRVVSTGQPVYDIQHAIVWPDGKRVLLSVNGAPILNDSGAIERVVLTFDDITERRKAEESLRQLNRELRAISNCNQILMRAVDEAALLNEICRIITEEAGYRLAWVGFVEDDAARTIRPVAWAGANGDDVARANLTWAETDSSSGPAGLSVRTGQTVYVQDFQPPMEFAPSKDTAGFRSGLALPLKSESERVFGILLVYSASANLVTPDELRLMEELAGDLAFGITILRAREEQRRVEQELQQHRLHLEAMIEERTRDLALARDAAEAANRAKSRFLANMSHELRTPLNAILGFTQLMNRDESIPETARQNLAIVNRSGEHLLSMINDVLDLSKIEAGKVQIKEETFDLVRTLEDVGEMLRSRAQAKGLSVIVDIKPMTEPYVMADLGKLRQVLVNLLGNAVKFTESGGVALRARILESSVEPPSKSLRATLEVAVEDTGPGIPAESLPTLFTPFTQLDATQTTQKGTGLGLSISRSFLEMMGGDISATSEEGKGSVFTLKIPVSIVPRSELIAPASSQTVARLEPGQPEWRVLVVEDSRENATLLETILRNVGFAVRTAENGVEGIRMANEWHPHFIWMDMRMPVMDGYEATRRIRAEPWARNTIIFALTASAFSDEENEILLAGCNGIIRKPYRHSQIFEAMQNHLGARFLMTDEPTGEQPPGTARVEPPRPEEFLRLTKVVVDRIRRAAVELDKGTILSVSEEIQGIAPSVSTFLRGSAVSFNFEAVYRFLETHDRLADEVEDGNRYGTG